jgi:photosystem II stability/assembly factor-like uncharacterized protein
MIFRNFLLSILIILPISTALAENEYLISIEGNTQSIEATLSGYPGRLWGRTADKIYLSGTENELSWLNEHYINNHAILLKNDISSLFISYCDSNKNVTESIFESGSGYVISEHPLKGADSYRRLNRKRISSWQRPLLPENTAVYSSTIETLIDQVNQDTLNSYLSRLTGNRPIFYSGGIDTIHTRYSGTTDNRLAGQYLKEILEGYGYPTEYQGFYSGNPRNISTYGHDLAWVVTEGSEALRTTDGGQTWINMPDNSSSELWGVANAGPDSVWITGNYGAIRFSSDGGATFVNQNADFAGFLFGICFINSRRGWVALDAGQVSSTTDGGAHWIHHTSSSSSRLYDVCFIDSANGWAVGQYGSIIHSTDSGITWSVQNSGTTERLYSVDFTSLSNGWAVGWGGVVLRTTNGGDNWQMLNLGDIIEKYHVDFTDSLHGYIAGWDGGIYLTSDGGVNWHQVLSGTSNDLYGLDFCDSLTGYAVGNGVILKTTNGGINWIDQTSGIETAWRNIIATKTGTVDPGKQVIICAHMDDISQQPQISAPGADDNGSGTIAVIEAARIFKNYNFKKTIKFCLWTGEEQGMLGSAAYAAAAASRGDTIAGVYNFDMIAYDGNSDDSIEIHCGTMPSSQVLGAIFRDVISEYDIGLLPQILTWNALGRSDQASFWDYDYPAILGIEDYSHDFNPYYHTISDNMGILANAFYTKFVKAAVGASATLAVLDTNSISIDDGINIPTGFLLEQNYPNPFNAATTILFSIPFPTKVNLSVYDLLGRKVVTLISGPCVAGSHSVTWNASDCASGIYVYNLRAGGNNFSKRLTLIK